MRCGYPKVLYCHLAESFDNLYTLTDTRVDDALVSQVGLESICTASVVQACRTRASQKCLAYTQRCQTLTTGYDSDRALARCQIRNDDHYASRCPLVYFVFIVFALPTLS